MAATTRGKLKEHYEGMHRNCDWIMKHTIDCLELVQDKNDKLSTATKQIAELTKVLDEFVMRIYANL